VLLIRILLLLCVDALMLIGGHLLDRMFWGHREAPPFLVALLASLLALIIHLSVAAGVMAASVDAAPLVRAFAFLGGVLLPGAVVAGVAYGPLVAKSMSHTAVDAVYDMHTAEPLKTDFSKARALALQDDIEGALKAYRGYLDEFPDDPQPLFEAAELLRREGRFSEAADVLREIMQGFKEDSVKWERAAFRLAELYEHNLDDKNVTGYILEEIVRRAPDSRYGRSARQWLVRLKGPGSA